MHEAAEGLPGHVQGDDVPDATMLRLQFWADIQFEAAVQLLGDERTAAASEVLLRALVEACAHMHFIASGATDEERACRAVRMEWGWAIELENLARKYKSIEDDERSVILREAQLRQQLWHSNFSAMKCKGGPRGYGDVGAILRDMVRVEPKLSWIIDIYFTASAVAHQLLPDRILGQVAEGYNDVVLPSPAHRAAQLDHTLVTYGVVGQRFFETRHRGKRPSLFLEKLQSIRNSPLLLEAMEDCS